MIPNATRIIRPIAVVRLRQNLIHSSSYQHAITKFTMPAMSPTMTEGGIARWKKAEGESFEGGDVLLEIETDKATIDVEVQDDGILGKIIMPDGSKNVAVGKTIALLAQEGDDISNLEVPKEEVPPPLEQKNAPSPTRTPGSASQEASNPTPPAVDASSSQVHVESDRPLFPSVLRLLKENHVSSTERIKGTGIRGMITKGDLLAFLGKASTPSGTFRDDTPTPSVYKTQAVTSNKASAPEKTPLDAAGIRRTILNAFLADSLRGRMVQPQISLTADSVIADYLPRTAVKEVASPPPVVKSTPSDNYLDGLY